MEKTKSPEAKKTAERGSRKPITEENGYEKDIIVWRKTQRLA